MIDAPDRKIPRFPPTMESVAREAIAERLDAISAGGNDLAVCSGACGGDLIFAEAVLARGLALEVYLPFNVDSFAQHSVDFAGEDWRRRFYAVLASSALHLMPTERPPLTEGQDPYEEVNLWMLEAAARFAAYKVVFIALWNGQGGDGPGGTQHMLETVHREHGQVYWIDTTQLWS